jgi:hypothetical protein
MLMSYAAVAAQGALVASTYNTQSVKIPPAPTQREIIVNITNPQTIQSLRAVKPRNLKAHADLAIAQTQHTSNSRKSETSSIPTVDIKCIGWFTLRVSNKAMSSVVIEFTKPEDANKIVDEVQRWREPW